MDFFRIGVHVVDRVPADVAIVDAIEKIDVVLGVDAIWLIHVESAREFARERHKPIDRLVSAVLAKFLEDELLDVADAQMDAVFDAIIDLFREIDAGKGLRHPSIAGRAAEFLGCDAGRGEDEIGILISFERGVESACLVDRKRAIRASEAADQ